jgi:hypothetical protein
MNSQANLAHGFLDWSRRAKTNFENLLWTKVDGFGKFRVQTYILYLYVLPPEIKLYIGRITVNPTEKSTNPVVQTSYTN